ncbi:MAG: S49 family peptidase [Alphaproteobacteria bacterium]|nr:S49 family peptidase [Alphaproteobacteria bacterium]
MGILRPLRFLVPKRFRKTGPVVSVVRMEGIISGGRGGFRSSQINMQSLAGPLERAFKVPEVSAVVLLINSPGGSPVQSSLIGKRVRALADEKEVPVFAFAEDVAASGGYWLACAADEIYADASSIIGSIGVISAGFGFQDLIQRYGIERRVYAAGDHKGALDPFQPENPDDVARLRTAQAGIHESFKELVRARRAEKMNASEDELFSGEFWTGIQAQELGLVDGIGDLRSVMRERFGDKVRFTVMAPKRSWLRDRVGIGSEVAPSRFAGGDAWVDAAIGAIEARLLWNRFGL